MAEHKPYMSEISLAVLDFKKTQNAHLKKKMAEHKPYKSEISLALLDFKKTQNAHLK